LQGKFSLNIGVRRQERQGNRKIDCRLWKALRHKESSTTHWQAIRKLLKRKNCSAVQALACFLEQVIKTLQAKAELYTYASTGSAW